MTVIDAVSAATANHDADTKDIPERKSGSM